MAGVLQKMTPEEVARMKAESPLGIPGAEEVDAMPADAQPYGPPDLRPRKLEPHEAASLRASNPNIGKPQKMSADDVARMKSEMVPITAESKYGFSEVPFKTPQEKAIDDQVAKTMSSSKSMDEVFGGGFEREAERRKAEPSSIGKIVGEETLAGLESAAADVEALARRAVLDNKGARQVHGMADAMDQARENAPELEGRPGEAFARRTVRGTVRSLAPMIPAGIAGGPVASIGLAGAMEASGAEAEAEELGMSGGEKAAYVAAHAAIETLPAAVFQKMGLGGAEDFISRKVLSKEAVKSVVGYLARQTGAELAEENITELGHLTARALADPNVDLTAENAADTVLQTTAQTALTMGLLEPAGYAKAVEAARADLAKKQQHLQNVQRVNEVKGNQAFDAGIKAAELAAKGRPKPAETPVNPLLQELEANPDDPESYRPEPMQAPPLEGAVPLSGRNRQNLAAQPRLEREPREVLISEQEPPADPPAPPASPVGMGANQRDMSTKGTPVGLPSQEQTSAPIEPEKPVENVPRPEPTAQPESAIPQDKEPVNPAVTPETEPVTTDSKGDNDPDIGLAKRVSERLQSVEQLSSAEFWRMADEVHGGTRAENKYQASQAYDSLELGVNMRLAGDTDPRTDAEGAKRTVGHIERLLDRIPTQTTRTGEKDAFQQFSTPPQYGFAAAWLANIGENDVVLEPSAGTGNLVQQARNANPARIIANELSQARGKLLSSAGADQVFNEDAEQISKILPGRIERRPSVVLMNPPFSRAAGRMGAKKMIGMDLKHVDEALALMEPGGRLVAVVGAPLHQDNGDTKTFLEWYRRVSKANDVRANVFVGRDVYKKYGTTFPTRVLVIDKTFTQGQTITGSVEDVTGLIDLLKGVRDDRFRIKPAMAQDSGRDQSQSVEPQVQDAPDGSGAGTGGVVPVQRPASNVDAGKSPSGSGGTGTTVRAGTSSTDTRSTDVRSEEGASDVRDTGTVNEQPEGDGQSVSGSDVVEPRGEGLALQQRDTERVTSERELTDALFEPYKPSKAKVAGAQPHPGAIVEPAAMAAVQPPDPTYIPDLPKSLIEKGLLSEVQLEQVIYAGQAHEQMLPAVAGEQPMRRGYMIGDGTGVGKGRTVSGILLDNWRRGRKKAVWVSENKKLFDDATRDWTGIGQAASQLFSIEKVKSGAKIPRNDGVLFTTYTTLGAKAKEKQESRLDQMVKWLGPDFDGVIIFDEAHNMANAEDSKGKRGIVKASNMALAGVELQKKLPNARVVYVSATAATEVRNVAYMDRLGLWGLKTPFTNKQDFIQKIGAGGVAAMEMVAQNLKAMGSYLSRSLSFDDGTEAGTVTYRRLEHNLTPEQNTAYDRVAEAWQIVLENINTALEVVTGSEEGKVPGKLKAAAMSQFWGAHQRFFNSLLVSMQTPAVIPSIKKDLAEGRSVVIQLTNTGEASLERALAEREEDQDLEDLDLSPRKTLLELVERAFPTTQMEEYEDEDGNVRWRPVVDAAGNPVENPEAVAMKNKLLDDLASLPVPNVSPIDEIIRAFGAESVSEVTGRKRRVVRNEKGELVTEDRNKHAVSNDITRFNDGKTRVLIFSQKGATGASYHASLEYKNQEKRTHYLLQAGWRADKALQGLGRTHRTNQAHAPEYILVHTNLKGQKRFISTIARRLDQLGALTRGQRQAGSTGIFSAADNLESQEAKDALRGFFRALAARQIPGVTIEEFQKETGLRLLDNDGKLLDQLPEITSFLNRLLSLKVDRQNHVFDQFEQRLIAKVEQAQQEGTLDQGVETLKAASIEKLDEQVVNRDERTGAETRYVKLRVKDKAKLHSWAEINKPNRWGRGTPLKFVRTPTGKLAAVFKAVNSRTVESTGEVIPQLRIVDVRNFRFIDEVKLTSDKYTTVPNDQAQAEWESELKTAPQFDEHEEHIISGLVLPVWDRLPTNHQRIYRLRTDDGEVMIGRSIPATQIREVLRALGAEQKATDFKAQIPDIAKALNQGGANVELANSWRVKSTRAQGETRIEVVGPDMSHRSIMERIGAFFERIQYRGRWFIPTGQETERVLRNLVENVSPVVDVIKGDDTDRYSAREAQPGKAAKKPKPEPTLEQRIKKEFPGALYTETVPGKEAVVTLPNGRPVLIQMVDDIKVDRDALARGHGDVFRDPAVDVEVFGAVNFTFYDRSRTDGIALLRLVSGKADSKTLKHERLHIAKMLGLFEKAEWDSLVAKYGKPGVTDLLRQEELIAEGVENWSPPKRNEFWHRVKETIKKFIRGVFPDSDDVIALMEKEDFWSRNGTPSNATERYQMRINGRSYSDVVDDFAAGKAPDAVGRPELANPGKTPEQRQFVNLVDENRDTPPRETFAQWDAIADNMIEQDRQTTIDEIIKAGEGTVAPSGVQEAVYVRAGMRLSRELIDEAYQGDMSTPEGRATALNAVRFMNAYRQMRTEQGRALAAGRDPMATPADRVWAVIDNALMGGTEATQRRIKGVLDKLREPGLLPRERARLLKSYENLLNRQLLEIHRIWKHLQNAGVNVDDIESEIEDPHTAAWIEREVQTLTSDKWDKLKELRQNFLLSALITHIRNTTGNMASITWDFTAQRMAEAIVNLGVRDKGSAQLGEFKYIIKGMAPGFVRGLRNGINAWRYERPMFEDEIRDAGGEYLGERPDLRGPAIPGVPGKIVRMFGYRPLTAMDEFFKSLAAEMEAGAVAYRDAKAQGLTGNAIAQYVRDQVSDLSSSAWQAGHDKAVELTFQEQPQTEGGKAFVRVWNKWKLWMFFPFMQTPVNMLRIGVRKSPLGIIALATRLAKNSPTYSTEDKVKHAGEQLLAYTVVTALGYALGLLDDEDDDKPPLITGSLPWNPADAGRRDTTYRAGIQPLSIRIGDTYFSYASVEPLATMLAMTVDGINAYKRAQDGQARDENAKTVFRQFVAMSMEKTYMKGLSDIIDAVQDPNKIPEWVGAYATSWVPNIVRSTPRAADPYIRETRVWGETEDERSMRRMDRLKYQAFPSPENAPPARVDTWGRKIEKHDYTGKPATDFLYRVLNPFTPMRLADPQEFATQLDRMFLNWNNQNFDEPEWPSKPDPYVRFGGQRFFMTEQEYSDYLTIRGQTALDTLQQYGQGMNFDKPTRADIDLVQKALSIGQETARKMYLQELYNRGTLQQKLTLPAEAAANQ